MIVKDITISQISTPKAIQQSRIPGHSLRTRQTVHIEQ
jgi:hypothetical protein